AATWLMSAGWTFARLRIGSSARLRIGSSARLRIGSSFRDEARRSVCGTGLEDGWTRGRAGVRHGAPPLSFLPCPGRGPQRLAGEAAGVWRMEMTRPAPGVPGRAGYGVRDGRPQRALPLVAAAGSDVRMA